jgi:hypothetical protein
LGLYLLRHGDKLTSGQQKQREANMQNSKVYEWKFFDSFVRAVLDLGPKGSHPVLDAVAEDLFTGALQRRDSMGNPVEPCRLPSDLSKSFLLPSEVNALPIMSKWRLSWGPESEDELIPNQPTHRGLTPQEEFEEYGWKGALQLEEGRLRAKFKDANLKLPNVQLAKLLGAYAKKYNIVAGREKVPDSEYIRVQVLTKKKDVI